MNKILIILVLVLLTSGLVAVPYTTLGEIKVPNAYVMPGNMFGVSYVSYFSAKTGESNEHDYAVSLSYGLLNWVEVGAVLNGKAGFIANAKLKLLQERNNIPAMTIGIDNLFSEVPNKDEKSVDYSEFDYSDPDDYSENSFYIAISKTSIITGLPFFDFLESTINFGIGTSRFRGNVEFSKQLGGIFASLEIRPYEYFSFIGELDGYNVNLGLKFMYKSAMLRAGFYRLEELNKEGKKVKIAINFKYTFDFLSKVKYEEWAPKPDNYSSTSPVFISTEMGKRQSNEDPLVQIQKQRAEERKRLQQELKELMKEINED